MSLVAQIDAQNIKASNAQEWVVRNKKTMNCYMVDIQVLNVSAINNVMINVR